MIFIVHATISDQQKVFSTYPAKEESDKLISKEEILQKAIDMPLPSFALRQIAEILSLILDRITALPSPWLEATTVITTWFTLHKDDGVLPRVFAKHPSIPKDYARVHKLLSNYINKEMKQIKDEEEHVKLL
jgi:hypothetical protein